VSRRLDFVSEYEAICETALTRESGPQEGLFYENLVTLSNKKNIGCGLMLIRFRIENTGILPLKIPYECEDINYY
jgi:hypothetical protein